MIQFQPNIPNGLKKRGGWAKKTVLFEKSHIIRRRLLYLLFTFEGNLCIVPFKSRINELT
jgi:hypothetical protein